MLISDTTEPLSAPLLGPDEPGAFEILNEGGRAKCILVCDHAANLVPQKLNNLGLEPDDFQNHYAWDIGVDAITRRLSKLLDAPAIFGTYSRLVVDLNRHLDHPTAFVTSGEGRAVPGNVAMSEGEKTLRVNELYEPFHNKLSAMIDGYVSQGTHPAIIAIHSFTPTFFQQQRPWEIGVLWVQDSRLPAPIMQHFRDKDFTVGDNEPYDARIMRGTTVNYHADARGLPNALIEVRNDLIDTDEKAHEWADMLSHSIAPLLEDEALFTAYEGPQIMHSPEMEQEYFDRLIQKAKQGDL